MDFAGAELPPGLLGATPRPQSSVLPSCIPAGVSSGVKATRVVADGDRNGCLAPLLMQTDMVHAPDHSCACACTNTLPLGAAAGQRVRWVIDGAEMQTPRLGKSWSNVDGRSVPPQERTRLWRTEISRGGGAVTRDGGGITLRFQYGPVVQPSNGALQRHGSGHAPDQTRTRIG